jgi:hypothetical protein
VWFSRGRERLLPDLRCDDLGSELSDESIEYGTASLGDQPPGIGEAQRDLNRPVRAVFMVRLLPAAGTDPTLRAACGVRPGKTLHGWTRSRSRLAPVDWSAFWLVLLGGMLSIAGGVLASLLAASREREARAEDRRERQRAIRDSDLRELTDLATEMIEARAREAKALKGAAPLLSEDVLTDLRWTRIRKSLRMKSLAARIGDEALREAVLDYSRAMANAFDEEGRPREQPGLPVQETYEELIKRAVYLLSESG